MKYGSKELLAKQTAELIERAREQHRWTMAQLAAFRAVPASETERLRLLNLHSRAWGFPRYGKRLRDNRRLTGVAA